MKSLTQQLASPWFIAGPGTSLLEAALLGIWAAVLPVFCQVIMVPAKLRRLLLSPFSTLREKQNKTKLKTKLTSPNNKQSSS